MVGQIRTSTWNFCLRASRMQRIRSDSRQNAHAEPMRLVLWATKGGTDIIFRSLPAADGPATLTASSICRIGMTKGAVVSRAECPHDFAAIATRSPQPRW